MAEKEVKLFSNTFMTAAFALANFILVLLLMWSVGTEYAPGWKKYQREYYRLLAERTDDPTRRQAILSTPLEIKQVWDSKLQITDRCMTCHLGVENPVMSDAPEPYKVHPNFNRHAFSQIGCTVCHEGQGAATTLHDAHAMEDLEGRFSLFDEQHIGWSRPLLPLEYVQASCNKCHDVMSAPIPDADHLNAGWQLVQEKGCRTCHYVVNSGAKQAPELSTVGTKFYNESGHSEAFHDIRFGYLKESLRCPQANLSHEAAEVCKAQLEPTMSVAASGEIPTGADLVKKYQCINCHSFDTPKTILGPSLYDIGKRQNTDYIRESILEPDKVVVTGFPKGVMKGTLSGFGLYKDIQTTPAIVDNLVKYLASLQGEAAAEGKSSETAHAAPAVVMPNFGLNDEELHNVVTFLLGLQERPILYPQKSFAQAPESKAASTGGSLLTGKSGEELVKAAGCIACHKFDGPERLVGPSLWDVGARQSKEYIRESILEPDKVVVTGFPPAVMKTTLEGTGFYKNVSLETLEQIVDYLSNLKGKS